MNKATHIPNIIPQPVTVPAAGNTVIGLFDVGLLTRLHVEIANITQAFDACIVEYQVPGSPNWNVLANATLNFTTAVAPMVRASGDLTALAAGATGFFILDVTGMAMVRLSASAAVNNAVPTVIAGGQ